MERDTERAIAERARLAREREEREREENARREEMARAAARHWRDGENGDLPEAPPDEEPETDNGGRQLLARIFLGIALMALGTVFVKQIGAMANGADSSVLLVFIFIVIAALMVFLLTRRKKR